MAHLSFHPPPLFSQYFHIIIKSRASPLSLVKPIMSAMPGFVWSMTGFCLCATLVRFFGTRLLRARNLARRKFQLL